MTNRIGICASLIICSFLIAQPVMSEDIIETQKTLEYVSPEIGPGYLRLRVNEYSAVIQEGATTDEGIMRVRKTEGWETTHSFELNGGRLPELRDIETVIHCNVPRVLVSTQTLYSDAGSPVYVYERHLLSDENGTVLGSIADTLSFDARGMLPAAAVVSTLFPICTS